MKSFSLASVGALKLCWGISLASLTFGCAAGTQESKWPTTAQKWFERAEHSYRTAELEGARHASEQALAVLPDEPEIRLLAARIALAELDFTRVLELTRNLPGPAAAGLRGRAYWYQGEVERAADELDLLLSDPDTKDAWATEVAQLARKGRGRRPFEMSGGLVAATEMPRVNSTALIVPVEINGEPSFALIATDTAEAAIDSKNGEGSWVSLRFGGRIEVSDVPAVGRDLSGIKRQVGAPIKMLIGVNLLRHLRATIDFSGSQFVVRNYEAPPPPDATTLHPIFYRGGAFVLPAAYGTELSAPTGSLLVNTSMTYPVALDEGGWKKVEQDPKLFASVPGGGKLTYGTIPLLRLGAFELPQVPGVYGAPVAELEKILDVDLDGFAGSGLFSTFRLTFADSGRTLWVEDLPAEVIEQRMEIAREAEEEARRKLGPVEGAPLPPASSTDPTALPPGSAP